MSQTLELTNVCDFMKGHLVDVFETMLQMKAVLAANQERPKMPERVSGSIGFGGDNINGAVYLHLSAAFAARATISMLGLPPEEVPADADVNDVVGEVSNMLTGGLKSWLCDAGALCAISTPGIIRGASFEIEPMPGVERTSMVFDCDGATVEVEIHVNFINPALS